MVSNETKGYVILIAAVGMLAGLIGAELAAMQAWEPITPGLAGKLMMHVATVIAAFVSGKLMPAPRQSFRERKDD